MNLKFNSILENELKLLEYAISNNTFDQIPRIDYILA